MNIRKTKKLFEENGVVALKADLDKMPVAKELLKEMGNTLTAIPYYAVYSPGWEEPVHWGGDFLTAAKVKRIIDEALAAAEKKKNADRQQTAVSSVEPETVRRSP